MFKKPLSKFADNLISKAMLSADLTHIGDKRTKKIIINNEITPFVRVPDVREFNINLGKLDLFFALFGISKRLKVELEIKPYRNRSINRYVEHQVIRLIKARDENNYHQYFRIADLTIKRSNCFRVLAINHVFPQWHKNFPLSMILNANRKCSKLINNSVFLMDYARVYIEKGFGK